MSPDIPVQTEISFQKKENRFRENLDCGNFLVLIEVNSPEKKEDFSIASHHLRLMEAAVNKISSIPVGLAVTDKIKNWNSWNVADFANGLSSSGRDRHVIFISGKNTDMNELADTAGKCKSLGFVNVAAATGNYSADNNAEKKSRLRYADSVHILDMLKDNSEGFQFFLGCVVNPFKYISSDLYPQYYKLVKKLRQGAGFIIAQSGWDIIKLQELRWYLEMRELHFPSIARFTLLTTELVEEIFSGARPGIHISQGFKSLLNNEARYGYAQFAAAQWRRMQIYAAGARLLGYSGIQISGLERYEHVATACSKIAESLQEFKTFEDWKDAYVSHLSRTDMTPYPYRFYMFNNLFIKAHPELPLMKTAGFHECGKLEKIRYNICDFLFARANRHDPGERIILKKIFAGCRRCSCCRLPLTRYICPETCPKGLANGPCGGARTNGFCEKGSRKCIHSRIFCLSAWLKNIDTLEERFIRPVEHL